jgi:predicted TIM-barrel fold metal-dependent hydrolase
VLVEGGRCHPDETAEFLRCASDTKPIVGVVAWIDAAAADVPDTIDHHRRLFGTARLMFGSDWPVCFLAAEYGQVRAVLVDALPPLTGPALSDIFAGTAIRTYGLAERVAELRPATV